MGVDQPSSGMSSLQNNFMPNSVNVGQQVSYVQDSSSAASKPSSNFGNQLIGIGNSLAGAVEQWKAKQERNKEEERQVTLSNLQAQFELETKQGYQLYNQQYQGDPGGYAKDWTAGYDQRVQTVLQGVNDQKVKDRFGVFATNLKTDMVLRAGVDQDRRYAAQYTQSIRDRVSKAVELIKFSPYKETVDQQWEEVANLYKDVEDKLPEDQKAAAQRDLAGWGVSFMSEMIMANARAGDFKAAEAALADKDISKYIPDYDKQMQISDDVARMKNRVNDGLKLKVEPTLQSYAVAKVAGKDTTELLKDINFLREKGVLDDNQYNKVVIMEEMSPQYQRLSEDMVGMTDTQFEDAVRKLDPGAPGSPYSADQFLATRKQAHDSLVEGLREQRKDIEKDPVRAIASVTGATDGATARAQWVASQLSAGVSIKNINVLSKEESERISGMLETAMSTGDMRAVGAIFDNLNNQYGAEKISDEYSMLDLVYAQLARDPHAPLAKRAVAVALLQPKGKPLDKNSILVKAATMTPEQRGKALLAVGLQPGDMGKVRQMMMQNETFRLYFGLEQNGSKFDSILATQQGVMLDAGLLALSSGAYYDTGAFGSPKDNGIPIVGGAIGAVSGLFGASKEQWAISDIIRNTLHVKTLSLGGRYSEKGPDYQPAGPRIGNYETPGVPTKLFGKIRVNSSKLLVPDEWDGLLGQNDVYRSVEKRLGSQERLKANISSEGLHEGTQDLRTANIPKGVAQWLPHIQASATKYGVSPAFVAAIMQVESGGYKGALSKPIPKAGADGGAQGLMQIIPSTFAGIAKKYNISGSVWDPKTNIEAGTAYAADAYKMNQNDIYKAAINYNGGATAVRNYRKTPEQVVKDNPGWKMFRGKTYEQQVAQAKGYLDGMNNYAKKVMALYQQFQGANAMGTPTTRKTNPDYMKYVWDRIPQGVTLKNTPDLEGVNVYVRTGAGQEVVMMDPYLKPVRITWKEMYSDRQGAGILRGRK